MIPRRSRLHKMHRLTVAVALAWLPQAVYAQQPVTGPQSAPAADSLIDWRDANDAVGQFRRGHADVLRWEEQNNAVPADTKPAANALELPSAADAVREAWRRNYELAATLSTLGGANVERIAAGRWGEVDPLLQRNIHGFGTVLKSAAEVRKAWVNAVAARQAVTHYRAATTANEAASELGRRMVRVGNWSKLQQARVELSAVNARMSVQRAAYAATRAEAELARVLRLPGGPATFGLPDSLPDLPAQPIAAEEIQQRLSRLAPLLPRAERFRMGHSVPVAVQAYRASHALALAHRDETMKLREFVTDESVLRYNGMLKSVWDLLEETATRSRASIEAIDAQRDFWVAESDLQLMLQGEIPDSFVSLGSAGGSPSAAAAPH